MTVEINNRTKSRVDEKLVREVAERFMRAHKIADKNLSIAFIGDTAMRRLNMEYRGLDRPTDVLSFSGEGIDFGEIILDYRQIERQGRQFSADTREELVFILVHGLLHLLGYDDRTEADKGKMLKLGAGFILKAGFKDNKQNRETKHAKS